MLVDREGAYIVPTGSTRLGAGDKVLLLADDVAFNEAQTRLTAPDDSNEQPSAP